MFFLNKWKSCSLLVWRSHKPFWLTSDFFKWPLCFIFFSFCSLFSIFRYFLMICIVMDLFSSIELTTHSLIYLFYFGHSYLAYLNISIILLMIFLNYCEIHLRHILKPLDYFSITFGFHFTLPISFLILPYFLQDVCIH